MSSPIYLIFILACQVFAIWPAPQSFESGSSVLWIKPGVRVTYNGGRVWWTPSHDDVLNSQTEQALGVQSSSYDAAGQGGQFSSQSIVQGGITRALQTLFTQNLVPWKLVGRNELANFEPTANSPKIYISSLTITQTGNDNSSTFKPLAGQVDESYSIIITKDGRADISVVSSTGVLHALETFIQLFYQHSSGAGMYTNLAPVKIIDAPKFQHRGLNMDVSRNWYPVGNILRTIDALSWNKFNRLHIHMTDAQSWPLEVPALPDLSKKGAYQTGLSYSPSDFQKIQTYAVERGVEVIVEFDMPGHTTSIGLAYPNLITAFDAHPWDQYCAEPPCGSLKLNSSAVDKFLDILFSDVLPRVKPYSAYFHTGGDEVNVNAYLLDDTVGSNDTDVLQPLIQKLVERNHAQIRKAGLTPMVWEEMALDWNLTLGKDTVVQAWLSDESVAAIAAKGYKVLAGNYNFWVRIPNDVLESCADIISVP
jgi:hexosaminidase